MPKFKGSIGEVDMGKGSVYMGTKGIMEQIREHLAQRKSSTQVIALGYAPATVYKVQRQLRRRNEQHERDLTDVSSRNPGNGLVPELEAENGNVRETIEDQRVHLEQASSTKSNLEASVATLLSHSENHWAKIADLELQLSNAFSVCLKCKRQKEDHYFWACTNKYSCPG